MDYHAIENRRRGLVVRARYEANPKACQRCGVPIPYERRSNNHCDQHCAALGNSARLKSQILCRVCERPVNNRLAIYCGVRCQQEWLFAEYIAAWKRGDEPGGTDKVSGYVRRYILAKFENRCVQCGWGEKNPVTGKNALHVDHIDGNGTDHSEENLRALCPNCHSLTPTYAGANRGRGRASRRARYRKVGELAA